VKVSWERWNVGNVHKLLQKLWVTGWVNHHDAAAALLIPMILFVNWS